MSTIETKPATRETKNEHPHRYTAALANEIEPKWQRYWDEHETFCIGNPGDAGFDASKPKYFCMDMFPYPSGAGLHVGHPEGYTATDIVSRYKRMTGHNVLHPMGWDAFGLPAEQYAIQTNVHPAKTTRQAIDTFKRQLKRLGFSYDWSREFATIDPDYYKWTQWIWLRAYHAWFDPRVKKARPIDELIAELERSEVFAGPEDELRFDNDANVRPWSSVGVDEQRRFINNHRLAYLAIQTVNWCPQLGTALANEEVIDGKSERGGFPVFRKPLKQWMFRITAFAERLLNNLSDMDWPDSTRIMQTEWIGRSEGAEVDFPLADELKFQITNLESQIPDFLRVYTTRPDTIFGATYMVLAPEHPLVNAIIESPLPETDVAQLEAYVEQARQRGDVERMAESKTKTGVFTGAYAINPATGKHIPIWVADYVLMGYGTGAIMAVPAQDTRDGEFAKMFSLPIVRTVQPPANHGDEPFVGDGTAINSANDDVSLNGLSVADAKARIIDWLEAKSHGRRKVNFKLRDWLFSRQRYWGEPFPVVFDEAGNHYPVSEDNLPVSLPELADFQPEVSDEPMPLLGKATDWVHTTAGEAGVDPSVLPPNTPVTRETNTMPNWAGSCWYYFRYCAPQESARFTSRDAERYWMTGATDGQPPTAESQPPKAGVDLYIGGAEHAVLHLLYARFWHMILHDLGECSTVEPFGRLFHQGMILSFAYKNADGRTVPVNEVEERDGTYYLIDGGGKVEQIVTKMSKTLKNVINPDDVIAEYGADSFRLYEMYMGPLDQAKPWNPRDIVGVYRFLQRAWRLAIDEETGALKVGTTTPEPSPPAPLPEGEGRDAIERALNRTIAKVGEDIDRLAFNTAIASMIEFVNAAMSGGGVSRDQLDRFVRVLAPFAPHMAEELWSRLGHEGSIAYAAWPEFDPAMLVDDKIEMPVQVMGKVRGRVIVAADASEEQIKKAALADGQVQAAIEGKSVRKVIVVPGKIVNIVAN